jgi:short-subunit dehydrogenase
MNLPRTTWVAGAAGQLGAHLVADRAARGEHVVRLLRGAQAHTDSTALQVDLDGTDAEGILRAAADRAPPQLVLCAVGAWAGGQTVEACAEETLDAMLSANLRAPWRLARGVLPAMRQHGGVLVFVTGAAAHAPAPGMAAYGAAKAALHSFVTSLRAELHGSAVTVHTLAPGTIDTASNRAAMPEASNERWVSTQALCDAVTLLVDGRLAPGGADLRLASS